MKWFEKEYKERFENESTLDGIEGDVLWNQIEKSIPKEKNDTNFAAWKWVFIVGLLIGALSTFMFLQSDNHLDSPSISETVAPSSSNENREINQHIKKENSTPTEIENERIKTIVSQDLVESKRGSNQESNQDINVSKTKANLVVQTITKSQPLTTQKSNESPISIEDNIQRNEESDLSRKNINDHKTNSTTHNSTEINKGSKIDSKDITNDLNLNQSTPNENIIESAFKNDSDTKELSKRTLASKNKRSALQVEGIAPLDLKLMADNVLIDLPFSTSPRIKPITDNPWSIGLESGATFFSLSYNDDQNQEPFADEANASQGVLQLGNYMEIHLAYSFHPRWSIRSGLKYSNYENELSTAFTKDTTRLYGTKIRKVKRTRTVNHHNKLSTFSIPLELTYTYSISNSWRLGTSIGASYSLVRSQQGRVLGRNETILDYSTDTNKQFENFMSWSVRPFLQYDMNEQWGISLNAGIATQKHNNTIAQELKQRSIIYTIGIGLDYKF